MNSAHRHFIGYIFLSSSPSWQSGSGSIMIPLVNMRSDYQFRIFHWIESEINRDKTNHGNDLLPRTKQLLTQSGPVSFEPGWGHDQVHLALMGGDGEMRVMFVTHDGKERICVIRRPMTALGGGILSLFTMPWRSWHQGRS
ncbi:hypothetical protein SASPL_107827 [Salvia splendens]|uniref:Uncharacterized protein n=1 Tax=Salvia splendens TaxID=180675 RepID=A0A8X8YE64_SALSN|nr:hypothetical protein SASPL_107827 [Salvia splendens]